MKKQECKHCGKKSSRDHAQYYNPTAGLWAVTTCTECGEIDHVEDVQPGFSNLASRHRWYLPLVRIACVVIFLICVAVVFNPSVDGRWRITLGIVAFLLPGLYGGLRGMSSERTTATNRKELAELIIQERQLRRSSDSSP